jgi:hypothetical protein
MPVADVAARISIAQGDLLQVPLHDATVVYAYLLPQGAPASQPFASTRGRTALLQHAAELYCFNMQQQFTTSTKQQHCMTSLACQHAVGHAGLASSSSNYQIKP